MAGKSLKQPFVRIGRAAGKAKTCRPAFSNQRLVSDFFPDRPCWRSSYCPCLTVSRTGIEGAGTARHAEHVQGYVYEVQYVSLGAAPPKVECVYVICQHQSMAPTLVRAALGLSDETVDLVRVMPDGEWQGMGLKPYQVKRAAEP